jgi:hypothetical protein
MLFLGAVTGFDMKVGLVTNTCYSGVFKLRKVNHLDSSCLGFQVEAYRSHVAKLL